MKFKKTIKGIIVFLFAISLSVNSFSSSRHNYHTSLTRMDYNSKDKLIEITVQLFTHDLVNVLEQQTGKRIDLEKTPDIDKILLSYLNENFILRKEKEFALKFNWVGKELKTDLLYVYVEVPFDEGFENLELKNSIFFESFKEQVNLIVFRFYEEKADLMFKVGDNFKKIKDLK